MSATVSAPSLHALDPVTSHERIETIDILRGFALLCILIVNWTTDTKWDASPSGGWMAATDRYAYWAADNLLNEKSWPMFAMLFGIGFAIQMERAAARGRPFLRVYVRRLAILAAIGVAHNILTERDILFDWALAGFVLIPLRKLPVNLLLALAVVCSLFNSTRNALIARDGAKRWDDAHVAANLDPAGWRAYAGVYEFEYTPLTVTVQDDSLYIAPYGGNPARLFPSSPTDFFGRTVQEEFSFTKDSAGAATSLVVHNAQGGFVGKRHALGRFVPDNPAIRRHLLQRPADQAYARGTFVQIVRMRATEIWAKIGDWHYYTKFLLGTWVFPPFLLGLYAGRRRIFHNVSAHLRLLRYVFWCSLAFAAAELAYEYLIGPFGPLNRDPIPFAMLAPLRIAEAPAQLALALVYLTGLALLVERVEWKRRVAWLAPVGRMALTNYLLQSVAFVLLFFGYGLGWYGTVGAFGGALMACAVFGVQVLASRWWLRRFRFGPAEWAWRSLTYGERQPMRAVRAGE